MAEGLLEDAERGVVGVRVRDKDGFVEADRTVTYPKEFGGGMGSEEEVFQGGVMVFLAKGFGELVFYGEEFSLEALEAGTELRGEGGVGGIASLLEEAKVLTAF